MDPPNFKSGNEITCCRTCREFLGDVREKNTGNWGNCRKYGRPVMDFDRCSSWWGRGYETMLGSNVKLGRTQTRLGTPPSSFDC